MKLILVCLFIFNFSIIANALTISNIKNDRFVVEMDTETIDVGERLIAKDGEGKIRALVEIIKVKDRKALGVVKKGQIKSEYKLSKYFGANASKKPQGGLEFGTALSNMSAKPTGASAVSMSGSSYNLTGFYQFLVDGHINARITGGYETLNVEGNSTALVCNGSDLCQVSISYLGLGALAQYDFFQNKDFQMWAGAGMGFLFAINKTSNIVDTSKISINQTLIGSLGLNWTLENHHFVPFQIDYNIFPTNTASSANQLVIRVGYGWELN